MKNTKINKHYHALAIRTFCSAKAHNPKQRDIKVGKRRRRRRNVLVFRVDVITSFSRFRSLRSISSGFGGNKNPVCHTFAEHVEFVIHFVRYFVRSDKNRHRLVNEIMLTRARLRPFGSAMNQPDPQCELTIFAYNTKYKPHG